jgi:hypothetical protein
MFVLGSAFRPCVRAQLAGVGDAETSERDPSAAHRVLEATGDDFHHALAHIAAGRGVARLAAVVVLNEVDHSGRWNSTYESPRMSLATLLSVSHTAGELY